MILAPREWLAVQPPVREEITFEILEAPEVSQVEEEPPVEALELPPEPLPEEELLPPEETPAAMPLRPEVPPTEARPNPNPDPNANGNPDDQYTPNTSLVEVPQVRPGPVETDEQRRRRMAALLNPSAVASGSFVATGPGPSRVGPPAGWQNGPPGPSEEEVEQRHNGFLHETANERPWLEQRALDLQRQADGSYVYTGHRFRARIRPDGEVVFADADAVQTNGFSASGTWDLSDAIMGGAGQDPHRAEREWFMRRTEDLRMRLETEHRRREMSGGLAGLRGRLVRVWNTTNRTGAARRRRIFDIWDDIAEDDDGARARQIVIEFIRDTLPQGNEDAYTESELTRLNANRASEERFAPY